MFDSAQCCLLMLIAACCGEYLNIPSVRSYSLKVL
jgi:hypothetical protein